MDLMTAEELNLTTPKSFTVCAGEPSSHLGRTGLSVSHTPFDIISLQFSMNILSAMLMGPAPLFFSFIIPQMPPHFKTFFLCRTYRAV